MPLPFDFTSLVNTFGSVGLTNVTFKRWAGNQSVRKGVALDDGFVDIVVPGPAQNYVVYPRIPKDMLERLPAGDRHRSGVLVWSIAADLELRTIDQSTNTRADRMVDNDTGLIYVFVDQWRYGRQSQIAGAIGLLLDQQSL